MTKSRPRRLAGAALPITAVPALSPCKPTRVPRSVDLPAPFRPITATISPACAVMETPRNATVWPWRTMASDIDRAWSPYAAAVTGRPLTKGSSLSRNGWAQRRASRTESGSGSQPASRPNSTTGGATGASIMISSGVPIRTDSPGPPTTITRSAYCTTRSSRCSARSTVTPRSCTSRARAASTSSAAPGSRAEVGSSSTSTLGCMVSTAPIATR